MEVEGGRKKISNEYPFRKERFVQDLGALERKFTLVLFTDDNTGFDDKNDLLIELEAEGNIGEYKASIARAKQTINQISY